MLRNYLAIALRQIRKNKSYILINTFGLGIALACCVTSYILLAFNIEFDDYFEGRVADNLYRVHTEFRQGDTEQAEHLTVPVAMGPAMQEDIPGVEGFTRFFNEYSFLRYEEKGFSEGIAMADSNFFDLVQLKTIKGDLNGFGKRNAMVLTENVANKFFIDDNPIGKILTVNFPNLIEKQFVVIAVVEKPPLNSTLSFDVMVRIEHMLDIYNQQPNEWGDWHDPGLLVKLKEKQNESAVEQQMMNYVALRNEKKEDAKVIKFKLEPFEEAANQDDVNWSQFNLKISNMPIVVFITMAFIILLIASFNLTNTSVAMASNRFKEIGIRKVAGATKSQIIWQFLFEMLIIVLLSLMLGLVISKFLSDEFVDMWGLPYSLKDINGMNLVVTLIMLVFLTAILAGLYPAMVSTRFRPVTLMKSKVKIKGSSAFTKSLVTLQFALSIIVLICGVAFTQNSKFQEQLDYGFSYRDVLSIFIQDESQYKVMKSRALMNPKVKETAVTHHQLGMSSYPFPVKLDTTEYQVQHIEVGENFFEVMGLELTEGRFLNLNNTTDEMEAIVVNRAFVMLTGLKDPLNQVIKIRDQRRKIVGVVEDHIDNLFRSQELEPFVYYASRRDEYGIMLIKSAPSDLPDIMKDMEQVWKKEFPTSPYQAEFQEEILLGNLRGINTNMKKIFVFLTILGGLLSIAGIYSLSTLNVEKRTKEIGIRKALGGSIQGIIQLLSREFVIILAVAAVVGGIGGYFLAGMLMDQIYAYHIEVKILAILIGVSTVCFAGMATTGATIFKAAHINPVDSLRDE